MKYLTAFCSALVWGSGQCLNRQRLKGLFFFVFQLIFAGIELCTGSFAVLTGAVAAHPRNAGFFIRGFWGLITLGEIPRESSKTLVYDHSIMLMLAGIIALMAFLLFCVIWFWNVRDAYRTRRDLDAGGRALSSAGYFRALWSSSFEYIVITPGMLLIIFISIVPIVFAILVAFTNYNMNFIPPRRLVEWTGFETFASIVKIRIWGGTFVKIFIWTVCWAFLATFSSYAFGFLQALLIRAKAVKFPKVWRSIFILPWAVPGIVSMMVFRTMLNQEGALNQILLKWGIISSAIPFLSDVFWARLSLVLVNVWLGFPYFMALISGVLITIPQEQYEAAEIDGANAFQRFRVITFPAIIASTSAQILMSVTFNFNNFNMIYFLTGGGPPNPGYQMAGSTDILISWIFKLTLDQRMYNYASALSILIFVVIASVSTWNLLRTRAFKED
ncbi:MAG: sugar ABC transporter permease [Spirochaetaceae bacterium]|jgi:arabinogalactan oligomer/maltooligosaccharide transport system permease protein|nr:sugar ABC transporter permease [Spirochaetaceae bacterium]